MGRSVKVIASFRSAFLCGIALSSFLFAAQLLHGSSRVEVYANRFSSLQAATNALPKNGGTVNLPCGTYGAVTISQSGASLVGAGNCTIITAPAAGDNAIVTVTNGATGTVISNLQIQGQAVDESTTQRCVLLTGSSTGTTIQQVRFGGTTSFNGCNIQIQSEPASSRNVITKNTLTQAIGTLSGGGYGMLIETSNGNIITDNVSIQTATQGRHHIYLSAGSSSNVVMNNQLSGGTGDQIQIYALDSQPTSQYNLIQGNTLTGMATGTGAEGAIHVVQNARFNRVIGNLVLDSAVSGIELEASGIEGESHADNNDVENNQVYFAGEFGIFILGSSNTTVKGNTVYQASQTSPDTYAGIGVSSDYVYATARNNSITNNTSYGSETQRCALRIDSGEPQPSATLVNGNRFGVGMIGIALDNGGSGTIIGPNVLNYQNLNPPKP